MRLEVRGHTVRHAQNAVRKRVIREYNYNVHSSSPPRALLHAYHALASAAHLARVHRLALGTPAARDERDVLLDDKRADLLLLELGRAATELVRALLLDALVGLDEVAEHLRVRGGDDARVDV